MSSYSPGPQGSPLPRYHSEAWLMLYAATGMKPNWPTRPQPCWVAAGQITGKTYKRGPVFAAFADLTARSMSTAA